MPTANPELVLTRIQRDVLKVFGKISESREFYLSGASALAGFYLGHRRSQDLDLFTAAEPLIEGVGHQMEIMLLKEGFSCQVVRRFRTFAEFVTASSGESTRLQLAQDSPFRLEPLSQCYHNVNVDTFRDLAANKLLAAYGRAAPRDLVDLYIMTREGHCTFDDLYRWGAQKDPGLDAYYLAQSLRTAAELPDRVESWPVDLLVPIDPTEMKRVLADEAIRLMDRGLPTS